MLFLWKFRIDFTLFLCYTICILIDTTYNELIIITKVVKI